MKQVLRDPVWSKRSQSERQAHCTAIMTAHCRALAAIDQEIDLKALRENLGLALACSVDAEQWCGLEERETIRSQSKTLENLLELTEAIQTCIAKATKP